MTKVNKKIGLIPKFQLPLAGSSLVAIYKAFIKHHLDYGDSFGGAFSDSFHQKTETVQYCISCFSSNRNYWKNQNIIFTKN